MRVALSRSFVTRAAFILQDGVDLGRAPLNSGLASALMKELMSNSSEVSEKSSARSEINRDALRGKTFSTISLGCPKNLVDSESTSGRLCELGARLELESDSVDFLVLNTCGFLRSAVAEAEEFIQQALEQKRVGNVRAVVVTGCAVASDGRALAERYPEATIVASMGAFNMMQNYFGTKFEGHNMQVKDGNTLFASQHL